MCIGGEQPKAPINRPNYDPNQIDQQFKLKVTGADGKTDIIQQPSKGYNKNGGKSDTKPTTSQTPGLWNTHS